MVILSIDCACLRGRGKVEQGNQHCADHVCYCCTARREERSEDLEDVHGCKGHSGVKGLAAEETIRLCVHEVIVAHD